MLRALTNQRGVGGEKKTKKNPNEDKEVQGDVEGKSFFKCCYNRKHLDEDYLSEQTDNPDEPVLSHSKKGKKRSGCVTCDAQIKDKKYFEEDKVPDKMLWEGYDDMDFRLLITELISKPKENPKEKMLSGCEVFLPDTLFYENGKPSFIAYNDKDFCLAKWNEGADNNKMQNPSDLIQKLQKITQSRKNLQDKYWL